MQGGTIGDFDSVRPEHIVELLDAIRDGDKERDGHGYSANRLHAYLSTFFCWCAKPGHQEAHHVTDGRHRGDHGTVAKPRSRYFNDDELKALWKAADQMGGLTGPFLKLLILTGKREDGAGRYAVGGDQRCFAMDPEGGAAEQAHARRSLAAARATHPVRLEAEGRMKSRRNL